MSAGVVEEVLLPWFCVLVSFLMGCRLGWRLCRKTEGNPVLRSLLAQPWLALKCGLQLAYHMLPKDARSLRWPNVSRATATPPDNIGANEDARPAQDEELQPATPSRLCIKSSHRRGDYMVIHYSFNYLPYRMLLGVQVDARGESPMPWGTDDLTREAARSIVTFQLGSMPAFNRLYTVVSGFRPLDDLLTELFGPRGRLPDVCRVSDIIMHIHEELQVPHHVTRATLHGTSTSYILDLTSATLEAVPCGGHDSPSPTDDMIEDSDFSEVSSEEEMHVGHSPERPPST
tara:strand:- start:2972 stop:3835 length:864 start_codon:yes stop_codon:yes gene_type:complete